MNGYLLMLRRSFDSEPLELLKDRGAAETRAREILGAYDPTAPVQGQPKKGRGELGPPGLVSRVLGIALVPFLDGKPTIEGRCYFTPEEPGQRP